MKDFLGKGEKSAFLTRDLIIKLNNLQRILKEEKRLTNGRLISTTVKELNQVSDKIYDNLRAYDVNGKLVTIDFQSIEATT